MFPPSEGYGVPDLDLTNRHGWTLLADRRTFSVKNIIYYWEPCCQIYRTPPSIRISPLTQLTPLYEQLEGNYTI